MLIGREPLNTTAFSSRVLTRLPTLRQGHPHQSHLPLSGGSVDGNLSQLTSSLSNTPSADPFRGADRDNLAIMDSALLRDEVSRNRVRQAEEFLDPSMPIAAWVCVHSTY
jgi:hypothetical protein